MIGKLPLERVRSIVYNGPTRWLGIRFQKVGILIEKCFSPAATWFVPHIYLMTDHLDEEEDSIRFWRSIPLCSNINKNSELMKETMLYYLDSRYVIYLHKYVKSMTHWQKDKIGAWAKTQRRCQTSPNLLVKKLLFKKMMLDKISNIGRNWQLLDITKEVLSQDSEEYENWLCKASFLHIDLEQNIWWHTRHL